MRTPWLTVFDHRFIDSNIKNFRHVGGSVELSTPPPQVEGEALPDGTISYHGQFDGRTNWFHFKLDKPLNEVIGIDARARIRSHFAHNPFHIVDASTFLWGGDWAMSVWQGQLLVSYRGVTTVWTAYPNTPNSWFDIRWYWRVTGQSILSFNGRMVAVRPDVHPQSPSSLSTLGFGSSDIHVIPPALPTPLQPVSVPLVFYFPGDIAYARISVLTRERVNRALDSAIPMTLTDSEKLDPCREEIAAAVQALTRLFRDLMTAIVAEQTKPWVREDGGRPITREGVQLHNHARQAAEAMVQYLTGNTKAIEDFQSHLDAFLKLLASLAGDRIPELADQVDHILEEIQISDDCRKAAEEVHNTDSESFERLESLLDVVINTVCRALGVDWEY